MNNGNLLDRYDRRDTMDTHVDGDGPLNLPRNLRKPPRTPLGCLPRTEANSWPPGKLVVGQRYFERSEPEASSRISSEETASFGRTHRLAQSRMRPEDSSATGVGQHIRDSSCASESVPQPPFLSGRCGHERTGLGTMSPRRSWGARGRVLR